MRRSVEAALWALGLLAGAFGMLGARREMHVSLPTATNAMAPVPRVVTIAAESLDARAARLTAGDPFRVSHRPSSVSFSAAIVAPPIAGAPQAPPKPQLTLAGITGPPWQALVNGFPGREGSVLVRGGDAFGALKVRKVTRDTVIVQGADTTWTLTLKPGWR